MEVLRLHKGYIICKRLLLAHHLRALENVVNVGLLIAYTATKAFTIGLNELAFASILDLKSYKQDQDGGVFGHLLRATMHTHVSFCCLCLEKGWAGVSVAESLFAKVEGQKVFSLPLLSGRSQIEMVRWLDWASTGQKEATLWLRLRKGVKNLHWVVITIHIINMSMLTYH